MEHVVPSRSAEDTFAKPGWPTPRTIQIRSSDTSFILQKISIFILFFIFLFIPLSCIFLRFLLFPAHLRSLGLSPELGLCRTFQGTTMRHRGRALGKLLRGGQGEAQPKKDVTAFGILPLSENTRKVRGISTPVRPSLPPWHPQHLADDADIAAVV